MKKILKIVSKALQVVLAAPIKLPSKAIQILKYVAVGLGIVESVLDKDPPEENDEVEDKVGQKESEHETTD